MPAEIKKKASFGSVNIDHFSPKLSDDIPTAANITISFEEALKLHIGLIEILGRLNTYNRATTAGRRSAVNLCVYPKKGRITINEGRVWDEANHREDGEEVS